MTSRRVAQLRTVPLTFPRLPPPLQGLKILHISDTHIGPHVKLADLKALFDRATKLDPDLIVVTGDLCDRLSDHRATLRLIEEVDAPLGAYAVLGNHEYIRGIDKVLEDYADSDVTLLVDSAVTLLVDAAILHVVGIDDPQYLHTQHRKGKRRISTSVDRALQGISTDNAFTMLLSHRPKAFDYAAPLGVDLVLSGHTHGYQLGFRGRSIFQALFPKSYIWGHYTKYDAQLYTSAGVGHLLMPIRLGCPSEAPMFVLHQHNEEMI